MRLIDHFPGTPRPEQEYILNEIEKSFKSGKRCVIIQAPTGIGKSHIGATLAKSTTKTTHHNIIKDSTPQTLRSFDGTMDYSGCFVLTTTKQLQDQYIKTFPESSVLKGKSNYTCSLDPTCDASIAPCTYLSKKMSNCATNLYCPYIEAYRETMLNNFSELNYSLYFLLPEELKKKEILVCDEASEIEDVVLSHFSIRLTYKMLNALGVQYDILKSENSESGYLWVCNLIESITKIVSNANVGKMTLAQVKKHKVLTNLNEQLKRIMNCWYSCEFIVELKDGGVSIAPLKSDSLARSLFCFGKKLVFMSATIINHQVLAKGLGLNKDEYDFIDVDSTFDVKKSPIYVSPAKYDMRYSKIDTDLPKLVKDVLELCKIHKDEKGIIHTNSFKITNEFKKFVKDDPRFLIREDGVSNEALLREHYENKRPTVLISPSLAFGTSLDNDYGRFQIITKLPYLPISEKRVKMAADKNFDWYQMKMWIKLIQMCGRCTRSSDDYSNTYIFDKSFLSAVKRYHKKLPKWFLERLI